MKKRWIAWLLMLAMLAGLLPGTASAAGGSCGTNLKWSFSESTGILTISGSGTMKEIFEYPDLELPWAKYFDKIVEVEIENGLTRLPLCNFENLVEWGDELWYPKLQVIHIPASVAEIYYSAYASGRDGGTTFRNLCLDFRSTVMPKWNISSGERWFFGNYDSNTPALRFIVPDGAAAWDAFRKQHQEMFDAGIYRFGQDIPPLELKSFYPGDAELVLAKDDLCLTFSDKISVMLWTLGHDITIRSCDTHDAVLKIDQKRFASCGEITDDTLRLCGILYQLEPGDYYVEVPSGLVNGPGGSFYDGTKGETDTRFSVGFLLGKDNNRFAHNNDKKQATSGFVGTFMNYPVSQEQYDDLKRHMYESSLFFSTHLNLWGGCCFGIAYTIALNYMDRIDVSEACGLPKGDSLFYFMPYPCDCEPFLNLINYYFHAQLMTDYDPAASYYGSGTKELQKTLSTLIDATSKGVPAVLSFGYDDGDDSFGHGIVALQSSQNADGSYTVKLYNENVINDDDRLGSFSYMTISADKKTFSFPMPKGRVGNNETITELEVYPGADMYAGIYDTAPKKAAVHRADDDLMLLFGADTDVTITVEDVGTVLCRDGRLSGTAQMLSARLLGGDGTPAQWMVRVPYSTHITAEGTKTEPFCVAAGAYDELAIVRGTGVEKADMKLGDTVLINDGVSGSFDFEAAVMVKDADSEDGNVITVAAHADAPATVEQDADAVHVSSGGTLSDASASSCIALTESAVDTEEKTHEITVDTSRVCMRFDMNGHGGQLRPQELNVSSCASAPEQPQEAGFTFTGWYADEALTTPWNFENTPVYEDVTVYAGWKKAENPGIHSGCASLQFSDAPAYGNWAHEGIDFCVEAGLMNGVGGGRFNPDGSVTRADGGRAANHSVLKDGPLSSSVRSSRPTSNFAAGTKSRIVTLRTDFAPFVRPAYCPFT